jgi:hypothetical protein
MLIYWNTPNSQKGGYEMPVDITWYVNAAFQVDTGKEILWFDPSVNKNGASPIRVEDINEPADFVFTNYGDPGHFINSVEVASAGVTEFLFITSPLKIIGATGSPVRPLAVVIKERK